MSWSVVAEEPRTSAGASSVRSEVLVSVPWIRPSSSRRSASIAGATALASARTVRSEPNPTARSRTRDGLPWRTSRPEPGPAAEHVAVHRRREQRVARDGELEGRARGAEDAEVRLGDRLVRARGAAHDRDLVDDDVGAAQERADPERADGEHADQDRHRDPRPLAAVEAAEHEVVDRPDEDDVAEQQHEQRRDRRQREAGQVRDRADDLLVVGERRRPGRARREQLPPHRAVDGVALGDPGRRRVEAEERHGAGAVRHVRGDDAVAGASRGCGRGPASPA